MTLVKERIESRIFFSHSIVNFDFQGLLRPFIEYSEKSVIQWRMQIHFVFFNSCLFFQMPKKKEDELFLHSGYLLIAKFGTAELCTAQRI